MIFREVHRPVLCEEVVALLKPKPGMVWVDGTVGAGGHAAAILNAIAEADVKAWFIGTDRDAEMLKLSRLKLHDFLLEGHRIDLIHDSYANLPQVLVQAGVKPGEVDAILLDLGANSMHFDEARRGFSFREAGPLDMRFDASQGETLQQFLSRVSEEDLARILKEDGEERFARSIARRIKDAMMQNKLHSTDDLAQVIRAAIPKKFHGQRIDPATKSFQALRIAVNDEFEHLRRFLDFFPTLMKKGGRVGIISFHSLEDRLVKNAFQKLAKPSSPKDLPKDLPLREAERQQLAGHAIARLITTKPVTAQESEIQQNPRSRSAKLRVVEML